MFIMCASVSSHHAGRPRRPLTASAPTPTGSAASNDRAEHEQQDQKLLSGNRGTISRADEIVLEDAIEVVHEGDIAGARDGELGRPKACPYGRL